MSNLGVAYGRWSLTGAYTILGQTFALLAYGNCRDLPHVLNVLVMQKVDFERKKKPSLPIEKFPS